MSIIFLLFDHAIHDVDRILVFSTEFDLDNLVKYKAWPKDGLFKCGPNEYNQLHTLHLMRKKCLIGASVKWVEVLRNAYKAQWQKSILPSISLDKIIHFLEKETTFEHVLRIKILFIFFQFNVVFVLLKNLYYSQFVMQQKYLQQKCLPWIFRFHFWPDGVTVFWLTH